MDGTSIGFSDRSSGAKHQEHIKLTDKVMKKLNSMDDKEFEKLDLYPG